MVGCVDGVPRDAVASRDAPDPARRRSPRAPRGDRRVAAADPVGAARRPRCRRDADRVFLIEGLREGGRQFTFGDLARRADRIAVALGAARRAGRATWSRGSCRTGSRAPRWRWRSTASARCRTRSSPSTASARSASSAARRGSRVLVVPGRGARRRPPRARRRAVQAAAPDLEHVLTVRAEPGAGPARARGAGGRSGAPLPPSPLGPHDVAAVFYTSGTTADPKGVLHTPSTLGAVLHYHAQLFPPSPDDRSLLQFPLTHIGGLVMFVMLPLRWGSSVGATWTPSIRRWRST